MCLEAVSEIDSTQHVSWDEKETPTRWNGRDLNALHPKHSERISSVALQRARFNNDQTGYILCKIERYSSDDSVGPTYPSIRDSHINSYSKRSNDNSDRRPTRSTRDYHSTSSRKHSHDKTSEADSEESEDKDSKTDMQQSISVGGKYDRDNHGHSSNTGRLRYKNSIRFENGHSLDVGASVSYERHVDRAELSDRTSGEIDASYNF